MAEVVRTRNSASILLPLTLMNLLNALLWTIYGLALLDPYVYLPNGIGAVLSLAQVPRCACGPSQVSTPLLPFSALSVSPLTSFCPSQVALSFMFPARHVPSSFSDQKG